IAIISEGINNATDILSSALTLIGSRLAGLHPDRKHPFGYGRVEYLTSLVISIIILVTGIETLINSIKQIFNHEALQVSYYALVIIAISAVVKFIYGTYAIKVGKSVDSSALEGVGIDSRNDCMLSGITILSSLVFLVMHISIDAYAGILISIMIIKSGLEILIDTIGELLGRPGEEELAKKLYEIIRNTDGILNAADMMLHNYGPDQHSGSVNIEIDHEKTVGDVYQFIHELQLKIMHEYNVTMVFGIYAVDNDHEDCERVRQVVADFIKDKKHVKNFHAVYLEPGTNKIYCDLVVDYDLKSWTSLREEFLEYMKALYPMSPVELTIETEFV
ncbi:MAG: cation diffusion facilitator family transporter, partial [Lachnospiraceae bacterium]|nr:cation diffusion facilitator family transporter [Lachnospiraceae bacterium]